MLGQMIGNILLPVIAKVLPYINAFVIALQRLFTWLAKILGIDLSGILGQNQGYDNSGISDLLDDAEGLGDALDDDADSAKKLKKQLQGFDALNNLTSKEDSGSGKSGLIGGLLNDAFLDAVNDYLAEWQKAFDSLEDRASEIADKIEAFFKRLVKPISDAWESAGYRVIDGFKNAFESLKKLLSSLGKSFWEVWEQKRTSKIFQNLFTSLGEILDTVGILGDKIREAWDEAENGTRILEGIRDAYYYASIYVEKMARNTKKWAKNLDMTNLMSKLADYAESLAPVIENLYGVISDFYNDVLLKLAKWTLEKGLPDLIQVFIDFNNKVHWVELRNHLKNLWDSVEKFGERFGEGIILFFEKLSTAIKDFLNKYGSRIIEWFKNFLDSISAEDIEKAIETIIKTFIGLKIALLAFSGLKGVAGIVDVFTKLSPAFSKVGTILGGLETKLLSLFTVFGKMKGLGIKGNLTWISADLKKIVKNCKNWLKALSPVKKAFLGIATAIAEFKIVNNAMDELLNGTDKIASNVAKIIASITGAGLVLGSMFGVGGVVATAIIALIAVFKALDDKFKETAQTIQTNNFSSIMQDIFPTRDAITFSDAMSKIADSFSEYGDNFARITNASQGFAQAKSDIQGVASSIDLIKIKMDNGVLSVEDGVSQLEAQFERLRQATEDKFGAIENTLATAFGENGVLTKALSDIGVDSTEIVSVITGMDARILDEMTSLQEQMSQVEYGSEAYKKLEERYKSLAGVTDEVTKTQQEFNAELAKIENISFEDLFIDGEFQSARFSASVEDVANSVTNAVGQMEDSRKALREELQESYNTALNSGNYASAEAIKASMADIETAYDNLEADIIAKGTSVTNTLQSYIVENVGTVIEDAKNQYENMSFKEKAVLEWDGIYNADEYASRMVEEYNNSVITPASTSIQESFNELGVDGAGWASTALQTIISEGFSQKWAWNGMAWQTDISENISSVIASAIQGCSPTVQTEAESLGGDLMAGLSNGVSASPQYKQYLTDTGKALTDGFDVARNAVQSHSPSKLYEGLGMDIIQGLINGFTKRQGEPTTTLATMLKNMTTSLMSQSSNFTTIGYNMMVGLSNGMTGVMNSISARVASFASGLTGRLRSLWQIHSPSRVMDEIGMNFMLGLQNGIEGMYRPIEGSLTAFGTELTSAPSLDSAMSNLDGNVAKVSSNTSQTINADSSETVSLLREQNGLLQQILEKEFGITEGSLFKSVQRSATDYRKMTGNPAF